MAVYWVDNQRAEIGGKKPHDAVKFSFSVAQNVERPLNARIGMSIGNDEDGWFDIGWYSDAPGVSPKVTRPRDTLLTVTEDGYIKLDMAKGESYFIDRNMKIPNIPGRIKLWIAIKDSNLNTLYEEKHEARIDRLMYDEDMPVDVPGVPALPIVTGDVVDSVTGEPLEMAEITNGILTALSMADGSYEIEVAPDTTVTLTCSKVGYESKTTTLTTPATGTKRASFALVDLTPPEPEPEPVPEPEPLWDKLIQAASDLITAKRTLAEIMGLQELQDFVDAVVEEYGDPIMPGGKKVILILPGAAVKKVIPKVAAKAEKDIAKMVMRQGAFRYKEFVDESLDVAVTNFMKMSPDGQKAVAKALGKYPDGRAAINKVMSAIADKAEKVIPAKAKAELVESAVSGGLTDDVAKAVHRKIVNKAADEAIAKQAPSWKKAFDASRPLNKAFKLLLGGLVAAYSYTTMTEWVTKEALNEVLSFPVLALLKDAPFGMPEEEFQKINGTYLPKMRENAALARKMIDDVAWAWPHTKELWTTYVDNVDDQIEVYQLIYDLENTRRESEEAEEEKVTFVIKTTELADTVTVNGEKLTYEFGQWSGKLDAGAFTIRIEKELYTPIDDEITLGAGDTFTKEYNLVPIPTKPLVEVVTVPGYVDVYVADKLMGTTNALGNITFTHEPGPYQMKFHRDGWDDKTYAVDLVAGKPESVTVYLDETVVPPTTGVLTVDSDPPMVEIWIGGEKIGVTGSDGILKLELSPFTGDVIFRKEGYEDRTKHVSLWAGRPTPVKPVLTKKPVEQWLWKLDISATDAEGRILNPKILINDSFDNKWAPDSVLLLPGTYVIRLEKAGYEPWEETITLEE